MDTEAAWSKSRYHGWWYGWQLYRAVVVGSIWIPVAADRERLIGYLDSVTSRRIVQTQQGTR